MRDTLQQIEGVQSVETDRSRRTAVVVLETDDVTVEEMLAQLAASWNGRYKAQVTKREQMK